MDVSSTEVNAEKAMDTERAVRKDTFSLKGIVPMLLVLVIATIMIAFFFRYLEYRIRFM